MGGSITDVAGILVGHALVFAGGSAFGLDAASGVVRYLEARNIGFSTPPRRW
jgi:L-aminopeptidase/D-esterase-like protein